MATTVNVTFDMGDIQAILRKRGLEAGGRVQQYVTTGLIGMFDAYVPFRTGFLKGSAVLNNAPPFEMIVYDGPYAARMYYGYFNFNGAPIRGRMWDKRAWADHKDTFLHNLQDAVNAGRFGY